MKRPDRLARAWQKTDAYKAYMLAQAKKTQVLRHHIAGQRVTNLVGLLVRADDRPAKGRSVLCVGCRNLHELSVFYAAGFGPIVGIDLVSHTESIQPMDMHALEFPDEMFDVIFACHSLEHAYDPDVVIKEWARVSNPGAVWAVEVPIRFKASVTDLQDFGSLEGLMARLAPYVKRRLVAEESADKSVARVVVQV